MSAALARMAQSCPGPSPTEDACIIKTQDYRHFLRRLPLGSVDLVLTDPPYAISRKTGFKALGPNSVERFAVSMDFGAWDAQPIDLQALSSQAYRVLRPSGTAIVFYDVWKITHLADAMTQAGFKQLRLVEWVKTNPVPLNAKINYLTNAREIAVLGVKGGKPTFHSDYDKGIYEFPIPNNGKRIHPTQKPFGLFAALINKHSNQGDFVVDPFLGSGTTAAAAALHQRRFAGCDMDPVYVSKAIDRLKDKEWW